MSTANDIESGIGQQPVQKTFFERLFSPFDLCTEGCACISGRILLLRYGFIPNQLDEMRYRGFQFTRCLDLIWSLFECFLRGLLSLIIAFVVGIITVICVSIFTVLRFILRLICGFPLTRRPMTPTSRPTEQNTNHIESNGLTDDVIDSLPWEVYRPDPTSSKVSPSTIETKISESLEGIEEPNSNPVDPSDDTDPTNVSADSATSPSADEATTAQSDTNNDIHIDIAAEADVCTTSTHAKEKLNINHDTTCSICLDEYVLGEEIMILRCQHRFHRRCIRTWLSRCGSCPLCKLPVLENSACPAPTDDDNAETSDRDGPLGDVERMGF